MRSASRASSLFLVTLAVAATLALGYGRVLDAPFVFDDVRNISANPAVVNSSPSFAGLRRAAFESPTPRPVAYATFAANAWWGSAPRGYRIGNLLLHGLNGLFVFALARLLYRRSESLAGVPAALAQPNVQSASAAVAALLFVAHPLQIQSVTYIVQRMTSLAAALGLAALLLWLHADTWSAAARRWARAGAIALFALACGAKEIALVLPATLWLIEAFFRHDFDRRWMLRTGGTLAALGFGALAVVLATTNVLLEYSAQPFTLGERLLSGPRVLWLYASWVALPLPSRLNLLHDVSASKSLLLPPTTLLAGIAIAAVIAFSLVTARRFRFATFLVLWFGLHLALETSIPPLALAFEHRLYLPLVGVAIAMPPLLLQALPGRPQIALALGALAVGGLLSATAIRNEVWRDPISLWQDAARKSPRSGMALDELGLSLAHAGRYEEARDVLTRATALSSPRPEAFAHLGWVYGKLGDSAQERALLREAIKIDPGYPRAQHAIGMILLEEDLAAALPHLSKAATLAPRDPKFQRSLAEALARAGQSDLAKQAWQNALALNPRDPESHTGLGRLARSQADDPSALAHFARAFELDPKSGIARNNLAWLRATSDDSQVRDPAAAWRIAAPLLTRPEPADPAFLDTVAVALAANGRFEEAGEIARRASRLAQDADDPALAAELSQRAAEFEARTQPPRDE